MTQGTTPTASGQNCSGRSPGGETLQGTAPAPPLGPCGDRDGTGTGTWSGTERWIRSSFPALIYRAPISLQQLLVLYEVLQMKANAISTHPAQTGRRAPVTLS